MEINYNEDVVKKAKEEMEKLSVSEWLRLFVEFGIIEEDQYDLKIVVMP